VSSRSATAWHSACIHARCLLRATQRCIPQDGDFTEYAIAHFKNYLFEISAETRASRATSRSEGHAGRAHERRGRHGREVIYNCCASGVLARVKLADFSHVRFVDERRSARATAGVAAGRGQPVEVLSRVNLRMPRTGSSRRSGSRVEVRSMAATARLSRIADSCYPRIAGSNEVIVYRYPSLEIHKRIPFPPMRAFYKHLGRLADTRLGFHHAVIKELS